jgi:hypothetical protein
MSASGSANLPKHFDILLWRGACRTTHVDLRILEPLLQIVVDGLIGNFAEQGKIRDSDLLLLRALEYGLLREP